MKKFVGLGVALLLSGCGFHLKGTHAHEQLPVKLWQVSGDQLQESLEKALRYASAEPVSAVEAQAEVRVLSFDSKRDAYTITRGAKLNEYVLSMRVTAQAYRDGKPWGNLLRADIRRTMPYSDSETLGKGEEEAMIWNEMRDDAARQIVRQLGAVNKQTQPETKAAQ
ncbi:LPS assembly lipoprotein LptE [Kingella negevensis]|uniref:LPS-assembly lipoprotein LptE n=1 Tax=Kingella negevensis TaxID=1522312 RepID=A0A238HGX1_9NEIS|nr:LPS assembly lipoprotein LptE [Kingella negevensis]MDK4680589.1 LPS assembly lipoprotein LptE [Kingella negevensis]MDK4681688.1 LPS assembly lipoprotein LptE [Kingella negevensis]MDK4685191.1 LPS assembly lipoprotein LptE [Kingella negevensis]MDK4689886.1 LPS assembly lipoprotein LptE [Kingella negevensis]MDK4692770.1 LPS assembly lipoprotein LptE [Kingella negevensis]